MQENKKIRQISPGSIKLLVDRFYIKVRNNEGLKHLFDDKIGSSNEEWQPHLQNMYDFWSSVMLSTGTYKGNPMQKHRDLPSFDKSKFEIWLKLFAETAKEIHPEEVANEFIEKSENIAQSLKYGIYDYKPRFTDNTLPKKSRRGGSLCPPEEPSTSSE